MFNTIRCIVGLIVVQTRKLSVIDMYISADKPIESFPTVTSQSIADRGFTAIKEA